MLHNNGPSSGKGRTEELALGPLEGGVIPQMKVSVSPRWPEPLLQEVLELVSVIGPGILMPPGMLRCVAKGGTRGKGVMCDKGTSRRECERKRKKQSAKKEEEKRKNIPSGCGKCPLRVAWECTYLSEKAGGA